MDKLLKFGNSYARESSWKDFALVKVCLFSLGLAAGASLSGKFRDIMKRAALSVFGVTYAALMSKVAVFILRSK